MVEAVPRFGPAAKAARAKEKELEAARLAKDKQDAPPAAKAVLKSTCDLKFHPRTIPYPVDELHQSHGPPSSTLYQFLEFVCLMHRYAVGKF